MTTLIIKYKMGFRDIFKKKDTFDTYIEEDQREERRNKPKLSIDDKIRIEKEKYESNVDSNEKKKQLSELKRKNFEMSKVGGGLSKLKQQIKKTGSATNKSTRFQNTSGMGAISGMINKQQPTSGINNNNNSRGFGSGLLIDQNSNEMNSPYLIGQNRNKNKRRLI